MSNRNPIAEAFNRHFNAIEKSIQFREDFKNGTGYLDGVVELADVDEGDLVTMLDDYGRKCILVGTLFGTVVIFQRYSESEEAFAINYPQVLSSLGLYTGTARIQSEAEIHHLFGTHEDNIGVKIKKFEKLAAARRKALTDSW